MSLSLLLTKSSLKSSAAFVRISLDISQAKSSSATMPALDACLMLRREAPLTCLQKHANAQCVPEREF